MLSHSSGVFSWNTGAKFLLGILILLVDEGDKKWLSGSLKVGKGQNINQLGMPMGGAKYRVSVDSGVDRFDWASVGEQGRNTRTGTKCVIEF